MIGFVHLRWSRELKINGLSLNKPITLAHAADSEAQVLAEWNVIYDAHNEVAGLMLGISSYVLKVKGYVEQLEHLGYVRPQDLSVGLILNGLTGDFAGFGLPKKAATPQVMAIQGGGIQKSNKKSLNAKGKCK
ncbi:hypothetical protein Tco_0722493 [Tanacetum coccineum]